MRLPLGGIARNEAGRAAHGGFRKAGDLLAHYAIGGGPGDMALRIGMDGVMQAGYLASMGDSIANPAEGAALFAEGTLGQTVPGLVVGGAAGAIARRFTGSRMAGQIASNVGDLVGSMFGQPILEKIGLQPMDSAMRRRLEEDEERRRRAYETSVYQQGLDDAFDNAQRSHGAMALGGLVSPFVGY
jgi:uncharacterized membrane protein YeaQ/YmgE (transglycosylase-associated protein family)